MRARFKNNPIAGLWGEKRAMPFQDSDQNGLAWGSQGTVYKLTGNTTIWQQLRVGALAGYTHPSNTAQVPPAASRVSPSNLSITTSYHTHTVSHRVHSQHTLFFHMFPHVCSGNTRSERRAAKGKARRITKYEAGQEFWVLNVEGPQTPFENLVKIKATFPPEINKILHILSESPYARLPSRLMSYRLSSL